jgi:ectoine hydroxylase-related dioxygenase (phytanoyl-CoA dioxygenase family)
MLKPIDARQLKETFTREGLVVGVPILTDDEVLRYRAAYDRIEADARARGQKARITNWHHQDPEIWSLATHPRVMEVAEAILGTDVVLISSGFFAKQPNDGDHFVDWHQDTMYWGLQPPFAITVWVAIDDSDAANGCMRVVPRTHNVGLLPHGKSEKSGNLLGQNQAIDASLFDVGSAVDCVLKAGQASIHHGESVHGSNPNTSDRRRCGMTIRFTTPEVKPIAGQFTDRPLLVRGRDRFGHFTYAPMPSFVNLGN